MRRREFITLLGVASGIPRLLADNGTRAAS